MGECDDPSAQDEAFQTKLLQLLDASCPTKTVKLSTHDKPYITQEIKLLDRKRKREYCKNGKSNKYLYFQKIYSDKLENSRKNLFRQNCALS